ncbi:MAG TPA: alpha amylase N-terminal ig-like domain-containing protein [Kofleriaceae bacterium]|nr:alpha amylase N-terminal ig-like domain-containing protein [Kofleriaceae bacterium]
MSERVIDEGGVLVAVTARLDRPVSALELCGELPCWQQPIAMQRTGSAWQAHVRARPGVYEIKLREPSGTWSVDPEWRTVARDGEHNGVLVIGGSDEPVLHAPASPWLRVLDDGRIAVRAALRHGHRDRLALHVDDGAGMRTCPMRETGRDGSHRWFEIELAGAGRTLEYAFVLADGRVIASSTGAFRIDPHDLVPHVPPWWRDAVVYTIFVDRFRRGGSAGGWRDPQAWAREHRAGGDLAGVREALPYLADLGVTALHLTPVCVAPSVHRYDAIEPTSIDPELGGDVAFARLVDEAHARGLRILVDVATTHVDRDFAPFRDVRAHGPASRYWHWFRGHRWPFIDGPDPGYDHYQKGQWREPLLALDEPEVRDLIVSWFDTWARRGVDGMRVDAAADLPLPLLARVRSAVRAVRPDAIVFGEVVPSCLDRFAPHVLDAATDFAHREAMLGWLGGESATRWASAAAALRRRGAATEVALGFAGTHDQPRIATVTGDAALARLGLVAIALGARIPLLYYGDEVGLVATAVREFEDSWPDRQPMPWQEAAWDHATLDAVRAALALRRDHTLLRRGDEELRAIDDDTVLIRRHRLGDAIDIVIHRGTSPQTVELPPGAARVLFALGDVELAGAQLRLGARALAVIDRREVLDHDLVAHNATIAAEAFAGGRAECPAYPTRLYVTVTEACNLRCAHCITDAPARTRSGRARTLQPWLLDALDEAFAHADYVAFTHGGESLAAPIFPHVLGRLARARGRSPGRADVHLASNGMLLDADRVAMLIDRGVTSVMVSLDGAMPATNDRIRVLGRFERVVANIAAAVDARSRRGADLRIGISTVVGASNVRELPALGRLCLDLGVDWLKLEETYPATSFARVDLLAADDPAVLAAMSALRDVVAGYSLVLVEHIAPPTECTCSGDAAARAFRTADDFANRATFRPCRAAWEQAAIDPDGTVHVVDYAGSRLGSLLDAPMLALWNAPAALAARDRALAASSVVRRRVCIAHDPLITKIPHLATSLRHEPQHRR